MYNKADFEKINRMLSKLDWSKVSTALSIDQAWEAWKELFISVIKKEVPSKIVGRTCHSPPWLDSQLKELIRQKHLAWSGFKRFHSATHLSVFCSIRNKVCSALCAAERQYLQSLHRDICSVDRTNSV